MALIPTTQVQQYAEGLSLTRGSVRKEMTLMSDDVTFIRGKPQAALPQRRGRLPVAWLGPGREMIVLGSLLAASPGPQQGAGARSRPPARDSQPDGDACGTRRGASSCCGNSLGSREGGQRPTDSGPSGGDRVWGTCRAVSPILTVIP